MGHAHVVNALLAAVQTWKLSNVLPNKRTSAQRHALPRLLMPICAEPRRSHESSAWWHRVWALFLWNGLFAHMSIKAQPVPQGSQY